MNYEMANADDPEQIILATQRSLINALLDVLKDVKKSALDRPGMTWDEIEYLLSKFKEKPPKVIFQKGEL